MINFVLDANQFISAVLLPKSKPAELLDLVRAEKVRLVVSQPILEEVWRILQYPKIKKRIKYDSKRIDEFIEELTTISEITPGKINISAVKDDPDDDKYLECAVEGEVDFIVSGDKHLKQLENFRGIRIVDPTTFLNIIKLENE